MTRFLLFAAILMASAVTSAANAGDQQLALNGLDPVYLCKGDERPGLEAVTAAHEGFLYRFAAEQTRAEFLEHPQRWAIQLDGRCGAMPSAQGDPGRFAVVDGRIYIFGSDECRTKFVADPARFLHPDQRETRKVAILVFEGVELLDFAGPGEVFSAAGHMGEFEVFTVAATRDPIVSQDFLTVVPHTSIESSPIPDILVIPGGSVGSLLRNDEMRAWIKRVAEDADHVLTVCNGALVLAELGLLDGLKATTHHGAIQTLASHEAVEVLADARYVDNGKIVTTAGVSAGIDGSLYLVGRLLGAEAAARTARYMEYDWAPRGD